MKHIKGIKKLLTPNGWGSFFSLLGKKEKVAFLLFFFLFFASSVFLLRDLYLKNTKIVPATGGSFIEGEVGHPQFINPVYGSSDADRDIIELVFSGLMKYNDEGEIVPDLAQEYKVLEGGKVYEFKLKDNIFWSDGEKITSDDVVFTVKTIQNPEIKSPFFADWLGVEVEKIDSQRVKFKLKSPYGPFLERATLKIIPKHIWKDVSAKNFPLVSFNLEPVGSGPYQFLNLSRNDKGQVSSLDLVANRKYYGGVPHISQISFRFFDSQDDLIKAINSGQVSGGVLTKPVKITNEDKWNKFRFLLPRYFAVFFNPQKAKFFSDKQVRKALNWATDKKEILEKVIDNQGEVVNSPLLPHIYGFKSPSTTYSFDLEKAKTILTSAGYVEREGKRVKIVKKEPAFRLTKSLGPGDKGKEVEELQKCLARDKDIYPLGKITGNFGVLTKKAVIRFQKKYKEDISKIVGHEIKCSGFVGKGTRTKLNEICFKEEEEVIPLQFTLTTADQPLLKKTALLIKEQWEKLGLEVTINTLSISELEREIKAHNYQALLFGEGMGKIPDPFPFWHSSQTAFGLNLAYYKNEKADELLIEGRTTLPSEVEARAQKYEQLQDIILEDAPAVFLYNPAEFYFLSKEVKGVKIGIIPDASKRFSGISNWYIETKRGF